MTFPSTTASITSHGLTTHYLDGGRADAPVVVLLHEGAFGASAAASWAGVLPTLAERYRVIAPDLYGYGASSKVVQFDAPPYELRLRQVAALLDTLGLGLEHRSVHLVGNSFGGAMALRATTIDWFAWRVRSAVSFGGTGGPYRTPEGMRELARFDGTVEDMERLVRFANGDFDGLAEHVAERLAAATAENYRSVMAPLMAAPRSAEPAADGYPEALSRVRVPVVAVAGRDDPFVEEGWAERLTRHAPLGRALLVGGRHSPNVVDPGATARLVLDILRENDSLVAAGHGEPFDDHAPTH